MQLFPAPHETIAGLSQQLCEGSTTCADVLERCLRAIDEHEPAVRAWVVVDREGAAERARELDAELSRGRVHGPLHGIPIGIKDIVDVAGFPTRAGVQNWGREVAPKDANLVARLRSAGAIILGKTVTTPFASFDPPPTRNPWNTDRTPGGSSSGSAAAVARGMCLAAIGTQTGGSITRPAAFCGVASCKPSFHRVSTDGILPFAPSLDHAGPIARCVDDLALVLDALSPIVPPWADRRREAPPRLGRLRGFFEERAEPSMLEALGAALDAFTANGGLVADVGLPPAFNDVHRAHRVIMCSEAAAFHEQRLQQVPGDYPPAIRSLIEEGLQISAIEYVRSRQHQERARGEVGVCFDDVDVLVCPAALGPAPDPSSTGDPVFNSPWTHTGLPTVSLPVALSQEGLPLAIQLAGSAGSDSALLAAARWCETVIREMSRGSWSRRAKPAQQ